VYRLLAQEARETEPPDAYDEVTIQRLWDESPPSLRRLLRHLMCHPDELISADDLIAAAGLADGRALGGLIGSLSKRCRARYHRGLPFEVRVISDRPFYVMSREVADFINLAR
jgi:hypothetical protein